MTETYEFGGFVLDLAERRLSRGDRAIPLEPKTYELLVALVQHAGRLVTKRELLDDVWPDAHVEEGIVSVHVANLRRALGDRRSIETVSRAGYRFAADVVRRLPARDAMSLRWPIGVLPAQPAVHELIGRGRSHLLTASRSEIPKADAAFRSAIGLDPTYAAAHAGLALACCAQAELRLVAAPEAYAEARGAALRALAMEPTCADAQVALGTVLFLSDWNWVGAQRSLERALELDPGHTDGYLVYGRLLEALGRTEEGLAAKRKALERNPSSVLVHTQIALSYWNLREYDEVIAWGNRALALEPTHLLAREYVAAAYWKKGDFDRHMAENIKHAETYGAPAEALDRLKQAYASGGRKGVVAHAIQQASTHNVPSFQLALLFGEAGNLDEAFRQLDLAIERRDPSLVHLAVAPQWDCLRGDPRFDVRLRRMGLIGRMKKEG
jgi:DNA-binding winged helix-turn-helix (wHTH) protein/Tfp pilus assembly protein PilF